MKYLNLFTLLIAGISSTGLAEDKLMSLNDLWAKAIENSPKINGVTSTLSLEQYSINEAKNHWQPKAYMGIISESTNSPSSSFFYKLSEQKIQSSDSGLPHQPV